MRGLSLQSLGWRRAVRPLHHAQRRASIRYAHSDNANQVDLAAIDAKWQKRWDDQTSQSQEPSGDYGKRPKAFILPMFPYPSGTLHLGHLRVYTISDVLARFKQMNGYDVIHPIGWDAFGLPAENAAIERGVHPEKWTLQNIETMKQQMKLMGGRWNWEREIRTCDPDFYKHTQRIFLMLHERGLAYQAESLVNYDPVDKTVLANEQVDANGNSWRSGAKVEKVMLKQWFLKIKEFQEPLLEDLHTLSKGGRWPERVLAMQKNWLGRSSGTKLRFHIRSSEDTAGIGTVDVFTTRADTIFGVQYLALALNHPIVEDLARTDQRLQEFLARARDLPQDSKEGYLLPHLWARNPVTEIVDWPGDRIPVLVAPYVLGDYGSGAVMGVPGHDTRDHAFWRANMGDEPIEKVINEIPASRPSSAPPGSESDVPFVGKGYLASHIPLFGGLSSKEAVDQLIARLPDAAERTDNWRLRDWLISRQRYWGTPIPIIHCNTCGPVPVPVNDLPVRLPHLSDEFFAGRRGNPLAEHSEWKPTTCPQCGSAAERETDTMDTFMDSSWYFFRFLDPTNHAVPVDSARADSGMQVDVYIGGVEHAILHLLYARFISKFLTSTSMWPKGHEVRGEPFKRLITQGMVHGKTYSHPETGRFLRPEEVDLSNLNAPIIKATGEVPRTSFEKMSKSRYNGVDPGMTIATFGADVTRAHMLFQAPVSDVLEWDSTSITGIQRWLSRVLRLSNTHCISYTAVAQSEAHHDLDATLIDILLHLQHNKILEGAKASEEVTAFTSEGEKLMAALTPEEQALWSQTQTIIASVTESYSHTYSLNTIISDLMTLTNSIWDTKTTSETTAHLQYHATCHLLRMLAPVAPAVAEEGWERLHDKNHPAQAEIMAPVGHEAGTSVFASGFPKADLAILPKLNPSTTCVFQMNGKTRFSADIRKTPAHLKQSTQEELAAFLFGELLQTEVGKVWLEKGTGKLWKVPGAEVGNARYPQIPRDWNLILVREGAVVNVVQPKIKKKTGKEKNVEV